MTLTAAKPVAVKLSDKLTLEWGHEHAEKLWYGLYARYTPILTNRIILDLGCSWGYMLKYISEIDKPKALIGYDVADLWTQMRQQWDYGNAACPITFIKGQLSEDATIKPGSVDIVLCTSVFQYMPPDVLEASLDKLYTLLKPGGEILLRTRCFTSYIGADLHTQFALPYVHMLYNGRHTDTAYRAKTGREPRYLNCLTASSYAALFHRCGFEMMEFVRRPNTRNPEIIQKVAEKWPWISPSELNVAEIEARLIKPMRRSDMDTFGTMMNSAKPKL